MANFPYYLFSMENFKVLPTTSKVLVICWASTSLNIWLTWFTPFSDVLLNVQKNLVIVKGILPSGFYCPLSTTALIREPRGAVQYYSNCNKYQTKSSCHWNLLSSVTVVKIVIERKNFTNLLTHYKNLYLTIYFQRIFTSIYENTLHKIDLHKKNSKNVTVNYAYIVWFIIRCFYFLFSWTWTISDLC